MQKFLISIFFLSIACEKAQLNKQRHQERAQGHHGFALVDQHISEKAWDELISLGTDPEEISPEHKHDVEQAIRQQIKSHKPTFLRKRNLDELVSKGFLDLDKKAQLLDYAFSRGHPLLYENSLKIPEARDFSINLEWIHKASIKSEGGHIFGSNNDKLKSLLIRPIDSWQTFYPDTPLNYWYDSEMVSPAQVENTRKILAENGIESDKVALRDIRDIPYVKNNEFLFEDYIPVYERVDLLKHTISDHVLEVDKKSYAVFTDLDIVPIAPSHLFDKRTSTTLEIYGVIFGSKGTADSENSFMITKNQSILNGHA